MRPSCDKIRLMIVDEHPIVRVGLSLMLANEQDIEVVAQAHGGKEAVDLFNRHKPDVILMDFKLVKSTDVDIMDQIRTDHPHSRIILFTMYAGDEDIYRGLQAGAAAYLLKDSPPEVIVDAIRKVHTGERYITQTVGEKLAHRIQYDVLTSRELDVLNEIAKGKSNNEIGDTLCIAEGTVKFHINRILLKLNVSDRTQAVILAIKRGLVRFL